MNYSIALIYDSSYLLSENFNNYGYFIHSNSRDYYGLSNDIQITNIVPLGVQEEIDNLLGGPKGKIASRARGVLIDNPGVFEQIDLSDEDLSGVPKGPLRADSDVDKQSIAYAIRLLEGNHYDAVYIMTMDGGITMSVQELKSPKIKTLRNLKEIRFSDPVIKEHQQNIANKNAAKWSFGLATVLTFPAMKAFFINFKKREVVNSRIFWFDEYEMVTDWSSVILHGAFLWFVCFCISYIVLKKTNILDNKKAIKKLSIRLFSKNPRRAILLIFCAILFLLSLII